MPTDTAETMQPVAARIVLVDDDLATRTELGNRLVEAGFEVRSLPDVATLKRTLTDWRPHLLILDEWLPQTTGRETALKLRAQGAFFDIPIVGLLSEASVPQALHWIRSGAVDLWTRGTEFDPGERAKTLLDELNENRAHTGSLKDRLTAWARRRHLTGTVLFYPETPFEGSARFESGELTSVRFSGVEGDAALEELLSLDDAPARWVPGDEVTGRHRVPGGAYRPRVLVVEDDDALRGLLLKQLAPFGDIDGAADGIEGLLKATGTTFDLVVADLNLPGLDGWGLMRQLRQNIVAREAAILVLSAHDELRETLKFARAGARAYLKKTGRAKPLLDTLELLLTPRRVAWDSLARQDKTPLDLRLVGPMWTLRAVAELDLVGTIQIEEPLGRFEVKVAHGQMLSASAQTGSLRIEGVMALESFLSSTGEGFFVPGEVDVVPKDAPWLFETAEKAGKALEAWLSARMRDAVSQPGKLFLHPELSLLFGRVASEKELKVLAALRAQPLGIAELSDAVGLAYEEVEQALAELLRRGVLMTEAPVDSSASPSGVEDAALEP
jgi:DNA-binding response OmpR family regulator